MYITFILYSEPLLKALIFLFPGNNRRDQVLFTKHESKEEVSDYMSGTRLYTFNSQSLCRLCLFSLTGPLLEIVLNTFEFL